MSKFCHLERGGGAYGTFLTSLRREAAVDTHQKARNVRRDPRIAIGIADPAALSRSWALRGSVVDATTDGARENMDELSQKCLGRPYPGFGGGPQQRVILTVKVDRVHKP